MLNTEKQITLQLDPTTDTTGNAEQVARMIGVSAWHISGDYLVVENPLLDYRVTNNETYSHKTDRIPNGAVVILVQEEPKTVEQQIEQEIQSKNLNAPRLTPDHIDSKIKAVEYILPRDVCKRDNGVEVFDAPLPLQTLTFCILTLENGFTVTGESACASPENFDAEIGKKIAYDNAREKIWLLEGYLLKENLHKQNSKVELQAGIDQLLNTRIPILDQIYDVCQAIEKCGASPELTDAVTKAGALRDPISKLVDQALKLGIGEGIVSVSYSDNGSHPTPDLPEFKNDDVKSFEPSCSTQACADGSSSSNGYQLNAKRENAFLVAQLLSNNKISAELRKKAETKMTALLDELI